MKEIDEKVHEIYRRSILEPINEATMDKDSKNKLDYVIKSLILSNVKKGGMDVIKAKKVTIDIINQETKKIINSYLQKAMDIKEDKSLNEAEQVKLEEFDKDRQKFVIDLVGKKKAKEQQFFDGIHGKIVSFYDFTGRPAMRFDKKDLKKILSNKNFRWVDIESIGF